MISHSMLPFCRECTLSAAEDLARIDICKPLAYSEQHMDIPNVVSTYYYNETFPGKRF